MNVEILNNYCISKKTYKVSNESMITYHGVKYSVPIQYVGKQLTVLDNDNVIHLYYNSNLINSYKKNDQFKLNYLEIFFQNTGFSKIILLHQKNF